MEEQIREQEQTEKVHEKTVVTRGVVAIVVVLVCLFAMTFTAYAYFSKNVTSGSETIASAKFEVKVELTLTDGNGQTVTIVPTTNDNITFKTDKLQPGKTYTVTIQTTEKSNARTGYIMITATNGDGKYYTQQLGADAAVEGGKTEKLTFKLMITEPTLVVFKANWGTSSHYGDTEENPFYVNNDERVKIIINGRTEPLIQTETKPEPEETTETTDSTVPVTTEPVNSEPVYTEPATTEPVATDPESTQPETPAEPAEPTEAVTP